MAGVSAEMLIRKEQYPGPLLERPSEYRLGITGRADGAAVAAAERLQFCRRVDIGDRHHLPIGTTQCRIQPVPDLFHGIRTGGVSEEAAGLQIRQQYVLAGICQDGRRFRHEMHATENDQFRIGGHGVPGQAKRVTALIG